MIYGIHDIMSNGNDQETVDGDISPLKSLGTDLAMSCMQRRSRNLQDHWNLGGGVIHRSSYQSWLRCGVASGALSHSRIRHVRWSGGWALMTERVRREPGLHLCAAEASVAVVILKTKLKLRMVWYEIALWAGAVLHTARFLLGDVIIFTTEIKFCC